MHTLLRISNDEACRTAVAQYVEKLRQAGIPAQISFIETEAQWDDDATARVVWGDEEQEATAGDGEDGDWLDGQAASACGVAPPVAEMYARTIAYLGTDLRAAREWLERQEGPAGTSAPRAKHDRRKGQDSWKRKEKEVMYENSLSHP